MKPARLMVLSVTAVTALSLIQFGCGGTDQNGEPQLIDAFVFEQDERSHEVQETVVQLAIGSLVRWGLIGLAGMKAYDYAYPYLRNYVNTHPPGGYYGGGYSYDPRYNGGFGGGFDPRYGGGVDPRFSGRNYGAMGQMPYGQNPYGSNPYGQMPYAFRAPQYYGGGMGMMPNGGMYGAPYMGQRGMQPGMMGNPYYGNGMMGRQGYGAPGYYGRGTFGLTDESLTDAKATDDAENEWITLDGETGFAISPSTMDTVTGTSVEGDGAKLLQLCRIPEAPDADICAPGLRCVRILLDDETPVGVCVTDCTATRLEFSGADLCGTIKNDNDEEFVPQCVETNLGAWICG